MKKNVTFLIILFFTIIGSAQQIGDGYAPITNDFSGLLKSGVFGGVNHTGGVPDLSYSGQQHLFAIRHENSGNNHQLQIASSFAENDRLFFRKIASLSLVSKNSTWIELATRGTNTFTGNQSINGDVEITNSISAKLNIKSGLSGVSIHPGTNPYFGTMAFNRDAATGEIFNANGHAFQINNGGTDKNLHFQVYNGTNGAQITNDTLVISGINGNVGIGTANPSAFLEVYSPTISPGSNDTQKWSSRNSEYYLKLQTIWNEYGINQEFIQRFNGIDYKSLVFFGGNVGIGIANPTNKLDVNGTIHSKEVKVDMIGWSDFVFKKEYNLPTLAEVEKHINEKGHLENIPSEEEVLKNGVNLGEMNAKLLRKIEELTLYTIQQSKEIHDLKEKNKTFELLSERLDKMEQKLK